MKWFSDVKTIEELRKKYRELLKKYHPDNAEGSVEATKEINTEYDTLFAILSQDNKSDGQHYAHEENEQFKAILNAIAGFDMTVEIIGSWIWCFDCYAYKDILKSLGFKWCNRKKAWVWHGDDYKTYHKKEIPLDSIRAKYGSEFINKKSKQAVIS